jgi:hypothetical protein
MTLLANYIPRATLAEQLGVSPRTIIRYENQADGLPVTVVGGRKLYRLDSVRAWLAGRERKPNPRRRSA